MRASLHIGDDVNTHIGTSIKQHYAPVPKNQAFLLQVRSEYTASTARRGAGEEAAQFA